MEDAICANCRVMCNENVLFKTYQKGAIKRGLSFELDKQTFAFLVHQPCYYCGRTELRPHILNGIDRSDNTQGYTVANCLSCCMECNRMKMAMSKDNFIALIRLIANNLECP